MQSLKLSYTDPALSRLMQSECKCKDAGSFRDTREESERLGLRDIANPPGDSGIPVLCSENDRGVSVHPLRLLI